MKYSFFKNDQFNFELQCALGQAAYGCGDVGEMLTTAERITDDDFDSWVSEWTAIARRVEQIAAGCEAAGHADSARAAYLRAAQYYAQALGAVDGTRDPQALLQPLFRAHRNCFDAFVAGLDPPAEQVEIPYEGTALPGYFFQPQGRAGPQRTLILNNGSDGPVTALWAAVGTGAVARGYNALIFDGPGQQSMLFERDVPFRHDWEKVITPVVNYLLGRPEVDGAAMALYGISQGGYWAPRALAFEHRLAAAVADPGVFDVSTSWLQRLPPELVQLLDSGDRETFDRYIDLGMRQATPRERQTLAWRSKPYGLGSPFDVFSAVRQYNLREVAERITTPMLITDPDAEQFWPGQAQQLFDALPGPKRLVRFTAVEGADGHCEPMARTLLEQRMFDWLDEVLAR